MLQVLEGYVYLGNTATLGEEAMNAFANVVSTAAHRVIRGVILTRQGLESKARSTSMVQELVKLLPPDLFRTCLARVRSSRTLHLQSVHVNLHSQSVVRPGSTKSPIHAIS